MERTIVFAIARREIRDSLRRKWIWIFSAAMVLLALFLSQAGMASSGYSGIGGFGRTAASLVNVVVLFAPLLGFTIGATTLAVDRERGTLLYLLAQPVTRKEVLAGKSLGAIFSILIALSLGFGIAGFMLARAGNSDPAGYLMFAVYTFLLCIVCTGLGLLIGTVANKSATAYILALVLWLFFGFIADLGVLGTVLKFSPSPQFTFNVLLLNPLQAFKVGVIYSLHSTLDPLGPVGQYAYYRFGHQLPLLIGSVFAAWALFSYGLAFLFFSRRTNL